MNVSLVGIASILLLTMIMVTSVEATNVPDWVKNTAGWWADDQIDDASFVNGIKFLIENDVLRTLSSQHLASELLVSIMK